MATRREVSIRYEGTFTISLDPEEYKGCSLEGAVSELRELVRAATGGIPSDEDLTGAAVDLVVAAVLTDDDDPYAGLGR